MKKLFFVVFLFPLGIEISFAQLSPAKVDERFELTSIVSRLAGAEEYMQCQVPSYAKDIDSCFAPYASHPLLAYFQEIRNQRGVSYNAISSMANALEIRNGKIHLKAEYDLRHMADTSEVKSIDYRWTKENLNRYLVLLNDFYKKSNFREFYDAHRPVYAMAEERMDMLLKLFDTQWFEMFYGKPFGSPQVYISLCNGRSNYSLPSYTNSGNEGFGILIGCSADQEGKPSFKSMPAFCTILHELAHNSAIRWRSNTCL